MYLNFVFCVLVHLVFMLYQKSVLGLYVAYMIIQCSHYLPVL